MIDPKKEDIGRSVVYSSTQDGVITSFNEYYVFVRYSGCLHANATRREDLEWA